MRKDLITEKLEEVASQITVIASQKAEVEKMKNGKHLLSAKVGSCLTALRSCMEYCSQDIYEIVLKPTDGLTDEARNKKNKYFPYGKDELGFKSMVGNYLPNLKLKSLQVYDLVESIQPHKLQNKWLYNLCITSNTEKHDTSPQKREDADSLKFDNGPRLVGGNITLLAGGTINGKKVDKDLTIGPGSTDEEIEKYLPKAVKLNFAKFTFAETGEEVISALEYAYNSIKDFYTKLYAELES